MKKQKYQGLTDQEVLTSREKHGTNVLTERKPQSPFVKLLLKFTDPLIEILLVAGVLSICISCYEYFRLGESSQVFLEPLGIFIAILIATVLAFLFEWKAEKEFRLLTLVKDDRLVKVVRNGKVTQVARKDIVVGDIVILSTGDEIPADGTLLEGTNLQVDESSLTGEPVCNKTTIEADFDAAATFPSNYMLRGTNVLEGHGYMKVEAVGDSTENGKVFSAVQIENTVKTPLDEQLARLSKWISVFSYVIAAIIIIGKVAFYDYDKDFEFVHFASYVLKAVMIAVTFIVVAVPEGLPMAVTLSLAYNMRRMLHSNNLVRRLHACETMGAVTVICTDKTGTLTQNKMQVADFLLLDDALKDYLYENIAMNSTAMLDENKVIGNPTEGALLLWGRERNQNILNLRNEVEVLKEIPFSTEIKFMSTTVRSSVSGKVVEYVKGAPEIVISMCQQIAGQKNRSDIEQKILSYQRHAMRTLAFAYSEDGGPMTMIGISAIADPIREEVPAAIQECTAAGIEVIIITGDSHDTALEIGRQIGVPEKNIISRARPMDKKEIVEKLQSEGQVVAVTGDGTNDAPALKAAHVGLSMGDGTSVAKEASDITIIDNSFASIVKAVMWGRSLYRNIQRFILFQSTVNLVACITVLIGAFMKTENPLNVTQMLWVNLIMDTFAAMALASLPPSKDVMKDKPRNRKAFIIDHKMFVNLFSMGIAFVLILGALLLFFKTHELNNVEEFLDAKRVRGAHLMGFELTFFFTTFVMLQFWNLFNVRLFRTNAKLKELKWGKSFMFIVALIFVGQILIVRFGGTMFGVQPLDPLSWLIIVVSTFIINLILGWILRKME